MMRWFRDFGRREDGTATVEFVLVFPLLAVWLITSYVIFDVFKSQSQAGKAAYTIADIVSRREEVNAALLDDLYVLLDRLLPRASDNKWMRISSITFDGTDYSVDWSHVTNPSVVFDTPNTAAELEDDDIPVSLMPAFATSDSIILVELDIPYFPIYSRSGIGPKTWDPKIVVRPRYIARIAFTGGVGT